MITKVFQIQKLLHQTDEISSLINPQHIFDNLHSKFTFRNTNANPSELSYFQCVGELANVCYQCVVLKILKDHIKQQKQWNMSENSTKDWQDCLQIIQGYSIEKGKKLEKAYHALMSQIKDEKANCMEFLLFLIFLSTPEALLVLCKQSKLIEKFIFATINHQSHHICVWACIIINYYLAKIKISPYVFDYLKKKFIKEQNQRTSANQSHQGFFNTLKKKNQQNLRRSNFKLSQSSSKVKIELTKQLDGIFTHRRNQTLDIVPHSYCSPRVSRADSFYKDENCLSPIKMICSSRQKHNEKENNILRKGKKAQGSLKRRSRQRKSYRFSKNNNNFQGLLGVALNQVQGSEKQKKALQPTQIKRMNLNDWKLRVGEMRDSSNIKRVDLRKRIHQKTKSNFEDELQKVKYIHQNAFCQQTLLKDIKKLKKDMSKRQQRSGKGFCEFIDVREPEQIGIVKGVVNYTCYSPEKKKQKIYSRNLRRQFEQFEKRVGDSQMIYKTDNNYNFRLQMALTGKI